MRQNGWPPFACAGNDKVGATCSVLIEKAITGYGGRDIQGIGDKHVTCIHNVTNMDAVMSIDDLIVTVCTAAIDRYRSVMADLTERFGPMDRTAAEVRLDSSFHRQNLVLMESYREGSPDESQQMQDILPSKPDSAGQASA